jgi:outer membrane murein-binding lipoprotein Lpp
MIAQEVKTALDTAGVNTFAGWDEEEKTKQQMLSTEMFVFPLIKAVQELSAKVEELESKLNGE